MDIYSSRLQLLRLVLSKLNFNDVVCYPLPGYLQKKMQRVQNAAASFVTNRYCSEKDVLQLGWLPTLEGTQLNVLKNTHRANYTKTSWPEYLTLDVYNPGRTLRSNSAPRLVIPLIKGTFQETSANLFNDFSPEVRLCCFS